MVSKSEIFTVEEASFLQYLYERYTINFGYNVSTPQINTICLIAQQSVGSEPVIRNVERLFGSRQLHLLWSWNDRNLQTATVVSYPLSIYFRMEYNTRFEEYNNISEYNSFFMDYVNSNTTKVTEDMQRIGLPVINVEQMIMFTSPTPNPTFEPSTLAPNTPAPVTTAPFLLPTSNPSEEPTSPPSAAPFVDISGDSFILGISLGLSGFFVAAVVVYMYRRHRERTLSEMQARSKRPAVSEHHNDQQSDLGFDGSSMGIELTYPESTEFNETQQPGHIMPSDQDNDMVRITPATSQPMQPLRSPSFDVENGGNVVYETPALANQPPQPPLQEQQEQVKESVLSSAASSPGTNDGYAHLFAMPTNDDENVRQSDMFPGASDILLHNASFSSDDEDDLEDEAFYNNPYAFDGSQDELDNYKNQDLEKFRNSVEEAVDNVEGMLSLAVIGASTESDETGAEALWPGAHDAGSIEAFCLWETYDWMKRNETSHLDARYVELCSTICVARFVFACT